MGKKMSRFWGKAALVNFVRIICKEQFSNRGMHSFFLAFKHEFSSSVRFFFFHVSPDAFGRSLLPLADPFGVERSLHGKNTY